MDRKTKIETMLMLVNNGVYQINDVVILADDFEILETINDSFTIKECEDWLNKNKITEDVNKLCQ